MTPSGAALFLAPVVPDAKGSGLAQRAFRLLTMLSAEAPTHLVLAGEWPQRPELPAALREKIAGCSYLRVRAASPWLRKAALILPWLVMANPSLATGWLTPAAALDGDPLPGSISRAVVFRLRTHGVLSAISDKLGSGAFLQLDLDDWESQTLASIAALAWNRRRCKLALSFRSQAVQYRLLEAAVLPGYNLVSLANVDDLQRLRKIVPAVRLCHLANTVDAVPGVLHARPAEGDPVFLFVGTLEYFPNEDAARWIAGEICAALREELGCPFRLRIAGRRAPRALAAHLARVPEVEFLGEVEDLAPLYRRCTAVLAPVHGGGGTKLKVLEAMAHGCPVIATPHAVGGLPGVAGTHFLLARDAREFAAGCKILVEDSARWRGIAAAGLQIVTSSATSEPASIE